MTSASYTLPPVVDSASVAAFRAEVLALRGQDLALNASNVERINGLGLQVLLATFHAWAQDGKSCVVVEPSAPFSEMLRLTGAAILPEFA